MLIIITGQTATGKTKLAQDFAKKYDGELVNFDSRQVYKYLDIITGKDKSTMKQFNNETIWLYDIVTPDQYFSSYDFVQQATKVIKDIQKRGKTPILVGGSYFYLKHLLYGFENKVPPNFKLREKLNKKSVSQLQEILKKLDVQSINQLNNSDRNNPRRLIRKIEIHLGKEAERARSWNQKISVSSFSITGLRYKNKENLVNAIKSRVEKRLKQGAIREVKSLLKRGYKKTDPGLKTIGYQQIISYLEGKISKQEAIKQWITAEVQYAKRQNTFMKNDKNINWLEID
ncbi:tRNA (adenosine(37)-N6)-dimethylallyltransferase MiaA [Candidatus Roizmanbacteria bacterium CG22_combo_CG10-13_8_21_14_all_35_9]|uniref:tRNA dimethylallyltransferase n=3 Tax=Candidatus Roizmaniibacteriota TaxID=1752723 RepID=A0A2H0BXP4_9BACT|nr:MAG: tRNA (adenosine(37)-N6)-dimethylallyltransferase MiaA [Candidatus Roizmanbacteria bacterium CG23_combo_of_CG06-09_8_20_14_all_35_49]PIP62483.1 MAG: tRNA (adenosine(37)-N6)-dimethylallyltransferase MiaA [Candidatus Roizmanbacteria bacterium CG22_combo_CG10-13_8_21_14_all_35_9]PIY71046.1 MAG: tRNA (adenosine(37)-N6)-dimethylallyltransferase MiaA [Candidatus Roizmanbacteria bacterium CG_4_10_14_0_8_um_filter_35_28]